MARVPPGIRTPPQALRVPTRAHVEIVVDSLRELVREARHDDTNYVGQLFCQAIEGKIATGAACKLATKHMRGRR